MVLVVVATMPEAGEAPARVGPAPDGRGWVVPTKQVLRPAGRALEFGGRPVDLVLAPDGRRLYAKDNRGPRRHRPRGVAGRAGAAFPKGGGSMHGMAVEPRRHARLRHHRRSRRLAEATVGADGRLDWSADGSRCPAPGGKDAVARLRHRPVRRRPHRLRLPLAQQQPRASWTSTAGKLIERDPRRRRPVRRACCRRTAARLRLQLGRAAARRRASGPARRRARRSWSTSGASAASGTVGRVDLQRASGWTRRSRRRPAPRRPGAEPRRRDALRRQRQLRHRQRPRRRRAARGRAHVDRPPRPGPAVRQRHERPGPQPRRPDAVRGQRRQQRRRRRPPRGDAEGRGGAPASSRPAGIPARSSPTASDVFVANVKGVRLADAGARQGGLERLTATAARCRRCVRPDAADAGRAYTEQVRADARVPQVLRRLGEGPSPASSRCRCPPRLGEPSVFEHVVYVIKENRTYDQVFGDIKEGNGDPKLCIFGRDVTPNHHALAERVRPARQLLLQRRPLRRRPRLGDRGQRHRPPGEVVRRLHPQLHLRRRPADLLLDRLPLGQRPAARPVVPQLRRDGLRRAGAREGRPSPTIYDDFDQRRRTRSRFTQKIGIDDPAAVQRPGLPRLEHGRSRTSLRVDVFLKELREFEQKGELPNLMIVFLPQDHTSGTTPGMPTPRAHVADNDLALGRVVEAISQEQVLAEDVHLRDRGRPAGRLRPRRRAPLDLPGGQPVHEAEAVVSQFYNQTSVLHTMERILGLPPMNQMDAMAPLMTACFRETPDLSPYSARPAKVPLGQLNPKLGQLEGPERHWAERSQEQDFRGMDRVDDDTLNRILWHRAKGLATRYPAEMAGAARQGARGAAPHRRERCRRRLVEREGRIVPPDALASTPLGSDPVSRNRRRRPRHRRESRGPDRPAAPRCPGGSHRNRTSWHRGDSRSRSAGRRGRAARSRSSP